jgi:cytosine/adenosine deaminase-related metal-dependent hydrolase
VRAGGRIYAGTDTSAATTPGLSLHHEMQLLVDAGLTSMQALMSATSWGAEIMGQDRRLGTIERGKLADLVLLDADPRRDIRNTKKIFKVIKGGRIVDTTHHADYEIAISSHAFLSRVRASFTRGRLWLDDSEQPREEPSAGKPHARIRGGEAEWPSYPTIPSTPQRDLL